MTSRLLRFLFVVLPSIAVAAAAGDSPLPRALSSYAEPAQASLWETLVARVQAEPFNLVASVIFLLAIGHTFLTAKFRHWSHLAEAEHAAQRAQRAETRSDADGNGEPDEVSFKGHLLHFLGEVEAVFGIWALVLIAAISHYFSWSAVLDYIGHRVNFTEPMFVVVVMAIAGTRPVLRIAEIFLRRIAAVGKGTTGAWWLAILIVAPVLGSFITEPAAMTIGALVPTLVMAGCFLWL